MLQSENKYEIPHEFVWNNYVITDMNEIANEFNRYFISIGPKKCDQYIPVKIISDRKLTLFSNSQQLMRISLINY